MKGYTIIPNEKCAAHDKTSAIYLALWACIGSGAYIGAFKKKKSELYIESKNDLEPIIETMP